jgi:hypothetical protein
MLRRCLPLVEDGTPSASLWNRRARSRAATRSLGKQALLHRDMQPGSAPVADLELPETGPTRRWALGSESDVNQDFFDATTELLPDEILLDDAVTTEQVARPLPLIAPRAATNAGADDDRLLHTVHAYAVEKAPAEVDIPIFFEEAPAPPHETRAATGRRSRLPAALIVLCVALLAGAGALAAAVAYGWDPRSLLP